MQQAEPKDQERPDAAGPSRGKDLTWKSRPRLRHDVLFADTGSGVLLRHADASFAVKGQGAYRFFSALAPSFTGQITIAELAEEIPRHQPPMLLRLESTQQEHKHDRNFRPATERTTDPRVHYGIH